MRTCLIISTLCLASVAHADGRVQVVNNAPQTEFKDALEAAAKAFDSENLDAYEKCFSEGRRKGMRRKMALLFAAQECKMELVEAHTIEVGENFGEAAVRYKIGDSGGSYDVVSVISMVKEGGSWVIDSEIKMRESRSEGSYPTSSYASSQDRPAHKQNLPDKSTIQPGIQHLIGDVGVRPGDGCANGRCGIPR